MNEGLVSLIVLLPFSRGIRTASATHSPTSQSSVFSLSKTSLLRSQLNAFVIPQFPLPDAPPVKTATTDYRSIDKSSKHSRTLSRAFLSTKKITLFPCAVLFTRERRKLGRNRLIDNGAQERQTGNYDWSRYIRAHNKEFVFLPEFVALGVSETPHTHAYSRSQYTGSVVRKSCVRNNGRSNRFDTAK